MRTSGHLDGRWQYGSGLRPAVRPELLFFVDRGVQVTSAKFVVDDRVYPLAGITSVAPFTLPAKRGWLIAGASLFGLFALGGLAGLIGRHEPVGFVVFAALSALCGWRARARKPIHGVVISTSGMQVRALKSTNLGFVQEVISALHQASLRANAGAPARPSEAMSCAAE